MKRLLTLLIVIALVALTGCGRASAMVRSEKERVSSPGVSDTTLAELVAGNTAFAFDL